ncbi:hypothetical protein VPH35_041552 [Triticum aestivum]
MSADHTRSLLDRMPTRKKRKGAPSVCATDRIGTLPDNMLHHLLSFLPAQAAVRTCVLARRWCDLWRSATGLRIVGLDDDEMPVQAQDIRKFVDYLLVLRERTDLDTVETRFDTFLEDDIPYVNLWVRSAVMCKVRVLTLHVCGDIQYHCLEDSPNPLKSPPPKTSTIPSCQTKPQGVALQKAFLYFARCPALEDLKMLNCLINANKISSHSLKHLSITDCRSDLDCRICVSTLGLVSLELDAFDGSAPLALLDTAFVYLGKDCHDVCLNYESGVFCGANDITCKNCVPISDDCNSDCVLLGGISSAKHLKLISTIGKFIFSRDLKHCPAFCKLKTLSLNEYWCEAPDLHPLSCILKNSPVLEKLTLELFPKGQNPKLEIKGSYCCMEKPSAISEHLNVVEVKCDVVNERILKVLKFLCAFNIHKKGVCVARNPYTTVYPLCFSYSVFALKL